jgi:hypothetical protein
MSRTMFHSFPGRGHLFLVVRTHSQLQYYLNLSNTRRAANDAGLKPGGSRLFRNVVEIHPLGRRSLA